MAGPYLQAALFVDRVLQEKDGVLSLIRCAERVVIQLPSDGPDELPEGGQVRTTIVIMMKSGDAKGRHSLSIRPELPSGATLTLAPVDVNFEGEDRGCNVILNLALPIMEGLYWVDVVLNGDQLLTRMPYRVVYQRLPR